MSEQSDIPVVPDGAPKAAGKGKKQEQDLRTSDLKMLNDVEVQVSVELGRATMLVRDILNIRQGTVIELDKLTGQPVDLLINNTPMAKGEIIVINGKFGFRITQFLSPAEP